MSPTIGSICSGAGLLDLGIDDLLGPCRRAWHAETDPAAAKVLAAHYPGVPNHGDITAVDWTAVEPVDILTAGWPCQPWSLAGKKKGAADERAIWPAIADAIRLVRPRIVLLENVRNVIALGELARVTADLARIGYVGSWRCVRADTVGAPHRRERVFIAAWPCEAGTVTVPARSADDTTARAVGALLPTPAATRSGRQRSKSGAAAIRPSLDMIGALLPTPRASDGEKGGPNQKFGSGECELAAAVQPGRWDRYAAAIARWEHILGRPAPEPTEPGKNGPRLAARFSEWLMGAPDGWVCDHVGRNDALRIIGNGVVRQQAAYAYRQLGVLDVLDLIGASDAR